jgi:predicted acylesterase/phospholipase RssA
VTSTLTQHGDRAPFSIVFAGGGCRTVWGMGVMASLGWPEPTEWAGVSAGAAMAAIAASGRTQEAMDSFIEAATRNRRNAYPMNALLGRPVFPHERIYRDVLHRSLTPGWSSLRSASPVRVLLAYVRPGEPVKRRLLGALKAYRQRARSGALHGAEVLPRGLETEAVTLQSANSPADAVDTVMTSSATWPVTQLPRVAGRCYVDGGLIDGVPIRALTPAAQAGAVLVLLSRPLRQRPPADANRLYLAPAKDLPVAMWDYTRPEGLKAAYELGRAAGQRDADRIRAFLKTG